MDLLQKGHNACKRLVEEYTTNPPNPIVQRMRAAPHHVGRLCSWLFPTEKQRGVLGWVLIAGLVALILRFLFGIHLEDLGKLLTKWFVK